MKRDFQATPILSSVVLSSIIFTPLPTEHFALREALLSNGHGPHDPPADPQVIHFPSLTATIIVAGFGRERFLKNARWHLDRLFEPCRPKLLLVFGGAGSISDHVHVGDVLVQPLHGLRVEDLAAPFAGLAVRKGHGLILTVDKPIVDADEGHALAAESGAVAVAMEGQALVELSSQLQIPALEIRVITDRIGSETYESLRAKYAERFSRHVGQAVPLLSRIKSVADALANQI
jgi:hypothetical protein